MRFIGEEMKDLGGAAAPPYRRATETDNPTLPRLRG